MNPDLPTELERIINKALEKDRSLRYQHASEVRTDLQRLKRDTDSGHHIPATSAEAATSATAGAQPKHTTSSSAVVAAAKQHKWGVAAGVIAVLIVLGAAGFGVYSLLHRHAPMPFQSFTITQVTNSGKVASAAISPDGKFVLSVTDDNGLQSLWLRNVPTGSDTRVIPPSASSSYDNLAFSPDGNYLYFRKVANGFANSDLYRSIALNTMNATVGSLHGVEKEWALAMHKLDFSTLDAADSHLLNRVIWYSTKGFNTPYPGDDRILHPDEVHSYLKAKGEWVDEDGDDD